MTEKKALNPNDRRLKKNNPNAGVAAAAARKKVIAVTSSDDVKFPIMQDMIYQGKGDISNTQVLIKQIEKLEPGNKVMSIAIPTTICNKKNIAQNLITAVKRHLKESNSKIVLGTRFIVDLQTKQYLGARIWRLL
jgi:hypothetical protein